MSDEGKAGPQLAVVLAMAGGFVAASAAAFNSLFFGVGNLVAGLVLLIAGGMLAMDSLSHLGSIKGIGKVMVGLGTVMIALPLVGVAHNLPSLGVLVLGAVFSLLAMSGRKVPYVSKYL
jgi:hypothetical protein